MLFRKKTDTEAADKRNAELSPNPVKLQLGTLMKLVEDWFMQQAANFLSELPDNVKEADVSCSKRIWIN